MKPDPLIFREVAIAHHLSEVPAAVPVRNRAIGGWTALAAVIVALTLAVAAASVLQIDAVREASAILRPADSVRVLAPSISGTVTHVLVSRGDLVSSEAEIIRFMPADLVQRLRDADRHVLLLESRYAGYVEEQRRLVEEQRNALGSRARLLDQRLASEEQSIRSAERRLEVARQLQSEGLMSAFSVETALEVVALARRQSGTTKLQLEQLRHDSVALALRSSDIKWTIERELDTARARRDALEDELDQAAIRAPQRGHIEALFLKPGDYVSPGQIVARLVPSETDFVVTFFLPERYRGFAQVNDRVTVEFEQEVPAPTGQFSARIDRIAMDLATPEEIRREFGDRESGTGPVVRVEATLEPSQAEMAWRNGMIATVRYTVKRERAGVLILRALGLAPRT